MVEALIPDRVPTNLHDPCTAFSEKRMGAEDYSMADIGLPASSLFFMQEAQLWEHDIGQRRSLLELE